MVFICTFFESTFCYFPLVGHMNTVPIKNSVYLEFLFTFVRYGGVKVQLEWTVVEH